MSSTDLLALWKLHQVDEAIFLIRSRAGALDPGKKLMAEIQVLTAKHDELNAAAHALTGRMKDLELSQQSMDERLKRIDKELYGGGVVNPREVENLEKEIENIKRQKSVADDEMLGLMDQIPPAQAEVERYAKAIAEKKRELATHQQAVLKEKAQLETDYKAKTALRPEALKGVNPALLSRYEQIRQKLGTAMSRITKERTCATCGLALAEKVIEQVKQDRIVTCEACHRILFYSESIL